MKKFIFIFVACAAGGYLVGAAFGAIFNAPTDWLVHQQPSGRPPRFFALTALIPILGVGYLVIAVKIYRHLFSEKNEKKIATGHKKRTKAAASSLAKARVEQ